MPPAPPQLEESAAELLHKLGGVCHGYHFCDRDHDGGNPWEDGGDQVDSSLRQTDSNKHTEVQSRSRLVNMLAHVCHADHLSCRCGDREEI